MTDSRRNSIRTLVPRAMTLAAFAVLALLATRGAQPQATTQTVSRADLIKRGEYLVTLGGCNDCHTPWKMGEKGPEPDMTRMLSGHPETLVLTRAPRMEGGAWVIAAAATNTAWAGPWGVSFTANLTPDEETGIGAWNEEIFINTLRTGKHWGQSRPILPPMPWFNYGRMSDDDLKAVFAYLRSIPPVRNAVPQPIPPGVDIAAANSPWE